MQVKEDAENLYRVERPIFFDAQFWRLAEIDTSTANWITSDDWFGWAQFNKSTNLLNVQLRQRTRFEFLVKNDFHVEIMKKWRYFILSDWIVNKFV